LLFFWDFFIGRRVQERVCHIASMKSFSSGLLLLSLNLFSTVNGFGFLFGGGPGGGRPGGGRPWGGRPWGGRPGHMDMSQLTEKWTSAGLVPAKIDSVPAPVFLGYDYKKIMIGETVRTENMLNRPILKWKPEWGSLYTIAILDFGFPPGIQYGHWLVSNVRDAWSVNMGDEVMDYIPPFGFDRTENGTAIGQTQGQPIHDVMALVYKQKNGRVNMADERQSGCDNSILTTRVVSRAALEEKYGLEMVAGTFFYTTYTKPATDDILCYFSKCTGKPFPYLAPGINDGPQCQQ